MPDVNVFDQYAEEYDQWFDANASIYQAEVAALRAIALTEGRGLEIGVGTGRFAAPLGIQFGVEPATGMARRAKVRGIQVCIAFGEALPFPHSAFDCVLLVTVDCFVDDLRALFREARRVLRPHGQIIIGHIDKSSPLGQVYESRKSENKFYHEAHFRTVDEITKSLYQLGFEKFRFRQTVLGIPGETSDTTRILGGYGEGAFVVIGAEKNGGSM